MRVDIDLQRYLARVTLYRMGRGKSACDMEVLDVESEETILWQHEEPSNSNQLRQILMEFFVSLRKLPLITAPFMSPFELTLQDKTVGLSAVLDPLLVVATGS